MPGVTGMKYNKHGLCRRGKIHPLYRSWGSMKSRWLNALRSRNPRAMLGVRRRLGSQCKASEPQEGLLQRYTRSSQNQLFSVALSTKGLRGKAAVSKAVGM